jgi:hypothetical protein
MLIFGYGFKTRTSPMFNTSNSKYMNKGYPPSQEKGSVVMATFSHETTRQKDTLLSVTAKLITTTISFRREKEGTQLWYGA